MTSPAPESGGTRETSVHDALSVTGPLLPRSLLEELESIEAGRPLWVEHVVPTEAVRRRAARVVAVLGPASRWRHLLELGAVPLLAALGWNAELSRTRCELDYWAVPLEGRHFSARATLMVTSWQGDLDRRTRAAAREALETGASWVLLFNGTTMRLLDARRPYAAAYLDVPVGSVALHARTRHVAARLWHPAALGTARAPGLLDAIVSVAAHRTAATRAALEQGVHRALETFGSALVPHRGAKGVLASAAALPHTPRDRLSDAVFQEALTLVFRVLFLLFAEARGLLPTWHRIFRESYSLGTLCAAVRAAGPAHPPRGVWATLQAIARLAHAGCDIDSLTLVAFNGRLFEPSLLPLASKARVSDAAASDVLRSLTTQTSGPSRSRSRSSHAAAQRAPATPQPIPFLDLGVEQLGTVYEKVLDYRPALRGPRERPLVLEDARATRKASGSFYTPRSLTAFLVRRALAPLVAGSTADRILELRVLDPAMGSGAFLVEACRYLTSAIERVAQREQDTAWDEAERTRVRRLVAQRCLFGVDVNPTAVQLARLSLWLAGLAKDRPLSFLDQHLRVGNSLVGASPLDLTRAPGSSTARARRDPRQLALFDGHDLQTAVTWAVPRFRALVATPDDSPATVRAKAADFAALVAAGAPLERWRAVADLWCGAWFQPEGTPPFDGALYFDLAAHCLGRRSALPSDVAGALVEQAVGASRAIGAFHWWTAFPDVFFEPDGTPAERPGFDAVIGNPPWEVLHREADRPEEPDSDQTGMADVSRLARYLRQSGQYPHAAGHVNCYSVFVERALQLVRRGGRLGFVLPWGLATDHGVGRLRQQLFGGMHVDTMVGFENRLGIFPIHRGVRFALVTASPSAAPGASSCAFGLHDPQELDGVPDEGRPAGTRWWALTPAFLQRVGGSHWTIPDVRATADVAVLDAVHGQVPPLAHAAGWGARFARELHATDDRARFHDGEGLTVVEGKHIDAFTVRALEGTRRISEADAARRLPDRPFTRSRLAYRDVSSPTNTQVVVAAVLPTGVVSTHTLFCLKDARPDDETWALCALLNSTVVSYLVAMRMSNHVSAALMHELPVPKPDRRACRRLARLARLVARGADGRVRAELDARCARAYDLSASHYARVLSCRLRSSSLLDQYSAAYERIGLS